MPPRIRDLRTSCADIQTTVLRDIARIANKTALARHETHGWTVNLLHAHMNDVATRLDCERALAKLWVT